MAFIGRCGTISYTNVWGPEVSYFANVVTRNIGVPNPLIEYSLNDAFKYALEHPDRSQDERIGGIAYQFGCQRY
ncbi:hypothetical protein RDWZM_009579 [Blomia tropicalis]|uniref:Uncharacterized protein n=1 Tax=Blomia tropicalis TaxID=40697 RepID=A0A9Q0M3U1_BLOTA|nr:hypothetical protein RDWZM_009579 [Blomia tropicalis]